MVRRTGGGLGHTGQGKPPAGPWCPAIGRVFISVIFSGCYFLDEKAISSGLLLSLDMFYPIAQTEIYNNGETCPFSENTSIE